MATGDQTDVLARIKATLPPWFGDSNPILDALLSGLAKAWANVYGIYAYALNQARIRTATDGWLDVISADFFGVTLLRKQGQADASFRTLIIASLFRERATRFAITKVCQDVTGNTPIILEPRRTLDAGAYSTPTAFYGFMGRYGSMLVGQYEVFVKIARPLIGSPFYGISDADIYASIASVRPVDVTVWVQIL